MSEVAFAVPDRDMTPVLPRVTLWRILVEPYRQPGNLGSGLVLPDAAIENAKWLTIVGRLVAMGEQAYRNEKLADSGNPSVGDWVVYGKYAGQLVLMADGREFRVMNDDDVLCVIPDPALLRSYVQ